MKKTKVIATISNHMCDIPLLEQLFNAGMNVVRMNTAHQTLEEALKVVQNVRAVSDQIALMIDTKGPEIRITEMQEEIPVKYGDIISVKGNKNKSSSDECLFVNYDDFVQDMSSRNKKKKKLYP